MNKKTVQKVITEIDVQVSIGEDNLSNLVGKEFTTYTKALDETISESVNNTSNN